MTTQIHKYSSILIIDSMMNSILQYLEPHASKVEFVELYDSNKCIKIPLLQSIYISPIYL